MQTRPTQVTADPASGALKYGMMGAGMGFDPTSTAVLAGAGAIYGAADGYLNKQEQSQARQNDMDVNHAMSANSKIDLSQQYRTPPQARHGMKSNRYLQVEIEGDGSGSKNGGGEIVTDKHYNIKKNAAGAPTHEGGGKNITISKGDIVFPTQNKNDHDKVLSAIQALKLKKDSRAKGFLDKVANSLPGNTDYDEGKLSKGYKGPDHTANATAFRKFAPVKGAGGYNYYKDPTSGLLMYNDLKTGAAVRPTKSQYDIINAQEFGGQLKDYVPGQPTAQMAPLNVTSKPAVSIPSALPGAPATLPTVGTPTGPNTTDKNNFGSGEFDSSKFNKVGEMLGNAGQYVNVAHNLIEGSKTPGKVERRYITAQEQEYHDMSAPQRRDIAENRNYMVQASGNNVNSSVSQGRQSQIGAQAVNQREDVNAREAGAQRQIMGNSIDTRNKVGEANVQLANQYDDTDAREVGIKQDYTNRGMADAAKYAELGVQRRYMKSRDDREWEMDKEKLASGNTKNYGSEYEYDDPNDKSSKRTRKEYVIVNGVKRYLK